MLACICGGLFEIVLFLCMMFIVAITGWWDRRTIKKKHHCKCCSKKGKE